MKTKNFAIRAIAPARLVVSFSITGSAVQPSIITNALAAENSGASAVPNATTEFLGEGKSGGIQREKMTRKVLGIRASTGADPPGLPLPRIQIGPDSTTGILAEGKSGGIQREKATRKASGIRANLGADSPGLPSSRIEIGPNATAASPHGVPPLGGKAPAKAGTPYEYDPRHEQFGADCFHCHGGPLFQSQSFANNGLDIAFGDSGRELVTGREGDKGRFAVPSLRNVEVTGPYMHDRRFKTHMRNP